MNIKSILEELELLLDSMEDETGVKEIIESEDLAEKPADMEQAEYDAVKEIKPEIDGDSIAKKLLKQYETVINELSDKLVNKVSEIRKEQARKAAKEFRAVDDEHTAQLAQIDKNYTTDQILAGKADADIDAVNDKFTPIEDNLRKVIKKAERNQELVAARNKDESLSNEKIYYGITNAKTGELLTEPYDSEDDLLNDYGSRMEMFTGNRNEVAVTEFTKEELENKGYNLEESLNEIEEEDANELNLSRQVKTFLARLKAMEDPSEENMEALDNAETKEIKNKMLHARWKKSKGIEESKLNESKAKKQKPIVVARFQENNNVHEIIKTSKGKYNIRYNVVEGKARFTKAGVQSLPVALQALKTRFPEAEEIKLNEGMQVPMSEVSAKLGNEVEQKRLKRLQKAQDDLEVKKAAFLNDEDNVETEKQYLDAQVNTNKLADKYLKTAIRNIKRQK